MSGQPVSLKGSSSSNPWMFLVPSGVGLFFFMAPLVYQERVTIPIAVLSQWVMGALDQYTSWIVVAVLFVFALCSVITFIIKPVWLDRYPWLSSLFNVGCKSCIWRILAALASVVVITDVGPEFLVNAATGSLVLNQLLPPILVNVIFAGILLPLLLNFGLLEFIGVLMTRIMRPLFRLPGRSAIDCLTSWVGDSSVGVLLTVRQYEEGHYTQREAAIIGTTFSAASITFCFLVLAQVQLEHLFGFFYLTTVFVSFIAALIVPRLPPLSWKKGIYIDGLSTPRDSQLYTTNMSLMETCFTQAVKTANSQPSFYLIFAQGLKNAINMLVNVVPTVMLVGTFGLVIAEYTPLLQILGAPFVPILDFVGLPDAQSASKTVLVGFSDMFIPSTLAAAIPSEMTRFVIAVLSVSQVVFLSETGAILLGSRIPINFLDLLLIFLLRTLITLPIIIGCAYLIF